MKKFLILALATCAICTTSQAAPVTPSKPVETVSYAADIASRANVTTCLNEREFIISRRAAKSLASAQIDIDAALAVMNIQHPVAVKKKPIRALRTQPTKFQRARIARDEKATPSVKSYMNRDTLPGEDRD